MTAIRVLPRLLLISALFAVPAAQGTAAPATAQGSGQTTVYSESIAYGGQQIRTWAVLAGTRVSRVGVTVPYAVIA